jgi:protein SCO1/2
MTLQNVRRSLALAVVAISACREAAPFHATVIADPLPAPALRLLDSRGATFDLAAEKGKTVLVYFGYTNCPDVCPTTLSDFAQAWRALSDSQRNTLRFVFVSVDPDRDTPAVMGKYVSKFDSSFVGLVPNAAQLDTIRGAWGFMVQRDSMPGMKAGEYGVSHPASVFLVNRAGKVAMVFPPATEPADLVADLKRTI